MKTIRMATFAAVTVAVPALLAAQDVQYATAPHGGEWAETIERARFMVDSVRRANNVPGISIAVSVVGEIVWSEGFGFANVEGQVSAFLFADGDHIVPALTQEAAEMAAGESRGTCNDQPHRP